jgi:hypothetical protein
MRGTLSGAVLSIARGCVGTSRAFADTVVLPEPNWGGILFALDKNQPVTGPGSTTLSNANALSSGSATASETGEPLPAISASAQAQVLPGGAASFISFAELIYDIEITGPKPEVTVDISGIVMGTEAGARLGWQSTASIYSGLSSQGLPAPFDIQALLPTGIAIPVQLDASAAAAETVSSSTSAYIDPYFSIDPSTVDAGAYSILVSPGIGNSPAAPEPSTWLMMLLGFAGVS